MAEDEATLSDEAAPVVYGRGAALIMGFAVVIILGYLAPFLRSMALPG